MSRAATLFTTDFSAARPGGSSADAPIFVPGLGLSGSTRLAQILASHPAVEGTMEWTEIGQMAGELRHRAQAACGSCPDILGGLDRAARAAPGDRYVARTAGFGLLRQRLFIDKMPDNFWHIALIHLILPHARIIDVRRAPMAAGLLVFKQYFQAGQDGQNYTADLTEIGRYYRDHVALMAHFDAVLPGRAHRIFYEQLVADTEPQTRALLDYCGLPFESACLRIWETARPIQTPSAQQVRRPIFREGLDQWRHFAPWLAALRDALGPLAEN